MNRILSLLLLALLQAGPAHAEQDAPQLMTRAPGYDLDSEQAAVFANVVSDPSVTSSTIVDFNASALSQGRVAFNAQQIFQNTSMRDLQFDLDPWEGAIYHTINRNPATPEASFSVNRSTTGDVDDWQVSGTIVDRSVVYSVVPLGGGVHVLLAHDPSAFPPDHELEEAGSPLEDLEDSALEDLDPGQIDASDPIIPYNPASILNDDSLEDVLASNEKGTLEVAIRFTGPASKTTGDARATALQMVDTLNQSFGHNALHNLVEANLLEVIIMGNEPDPPSMLAGGISLMDHDDGRYDALNEAVRMGEADVGVLVVRESKRCGRAGKILADRESRFALVKSECALANRSFAHEVGHLFGARHDIDADQETEPFEFGHGFKDQDGNWRTIMAYPCSPPGCPRRLYWSDPTTLIGGCEGRE